MRNNFNLLSLIASVATLLVTTGCNTVSISTNAVLGVPTYPPNPAPATIQVMTAPPTRTHIRLGEIQTEPASSSVRASEITASLQKAAAKLGADAVVIVSDRNQVMGAMVTGGWYNRSVQAIDQRVIIGVAIKYQ